MATSNAFSSLAPDEGDDDDDAAEAHSETAATAATPADDDAPGHAAAGPGHRVEAAATARAKPGGGLGEWQLLVDGQLERLRHELSEQSAKSDAQMKGMRVLIEGQMRRQGEVQEALRSHAGVITREVCVWTKRYINAKFVVFGDSNDLKVDMQWRAVGAESCATDE
jgi:hypothetical protein